MGWCLCLCQRINAHNVSNAIRTDNLGHSPADRSVCVVLRYLGNFFARQGKMTICSNTKVTSGRRSYVWVISVREIERINYFIRPCLINRVPGLSTTPTTTQPLVGFDIVDGNDLAFLALWAILGTIGWNLQERSFGCLAGDWDWLLISLPITEKSPSGAHFQKKWK